MLLESGGWSHLWISRTRLRYGKDVVSVACRVSLEIVARPAYKQVVGQQNFAMGAVVFLYSAQSKLASITIVHLDENGLTAAAAAMATMILATALAAKALHLVLSVYVLGSLQAWRAWPA